MTVIRLDPASDVDVDRYRTIRLRALATDPDAFGSSLEREAQFDHATWRARVAGFAGRPGAVFVAAPSDSGVGDHADDSLLGVVGVALAEPLDAMIWGMWVAPQGRRRGTAGLLLDAAEQWATEAGVEATTLWVHRTNDSARLLYERRGYRHVDDADLPADVPPACSDEICMRMRR